MADIQPTPTAAPAPAAEGVGAAVPPTPAVTIPRGGGAIRGIGESFTTNPATGTAAATIPIALSPARADLVPQLALSYDSGTGNGPFGFGWSLSLARIERRTDRGVPRYRPSEHASGVGRPVTAAPDTFMLSGAEELVPIDDGVEIDGHTVRRYRPRVDSLFARIERWTRLDDGDIHWRSISRDNVTNLYGLTGASRIEQPGQTFAWLICETYDDRGNAVLYEYAAEGPEGVEGVEGVDQPHEARRERTTSRYPKRIRYGNVVSRLHPDPPADWRDELLFEVVFDYGEGHVRPVDGVGDQVQAAAAADAVVPRRWPVRPDPFSTYRAGFEVRSYRRCQRILQFHRFAELGAEPCLVRSITIDYADLDYASAPDVDAELAHPGSTRFASFVRSVTQSGHVRLADVDPEDVDGVRYVTYRTRSLPPVELDYSRARIDDQVRAPDAATLADLPIGLSGDVRLVDLDGDGVAGILSAHDGAWFYKPALGDARFGPRQVVASHTALGRLGPARQLVDVDGDGGLDLLVLDRTARGFHERTPDGGAGWAPFRSFPQQPTISLLDPNVRMVDLSGDGRADILVTEDDVITCYRSLGDDGFDAPEHVRKGWDDDRGPALVLADRDEAVYLADMSGDGLSDLVRIRNGDVSYWPSLGYGRFGAKVTMSDAPRLDDPDLFDHRRLRLTDIDGSGPSDLVYLGREGVRIYLNRSGNSWTGARLLPELPAVDRVSAVNTADLLGRGTSCLVWSTPLPGRTVALRYVDLMADGKPHLLTRLANNLGSETQVHYAPSTRFALADEAAGRPWPHRLPFPVQVVTRVDVLDRVSGNRFVTRFAYHDGRYDGIEREFCGFGQVDQWDTEEWAALNAGTVPGGSNVDTTSDVPPTLTRTWFHTGAAPPGADREAHRALKGSELRHEVYGLDGSAKAPHPYTRTDRTFRTREPYPRVFVVHLHESVEATHERNPSDPRVRHKLVLEADDHGNERRFAVVAYPRAAPDTNLDPRERLQQAKLRIVLTEADVTNPVEGADDHRAPLPSEIRTYEVTGVALPGGQARYTHSDLDGPAGTRRLIEHVRTIYRRDDLTGPLPLGQLQPQALPFDSYKLAFTPALLTSLFGGRVTDAMLVETGYQHSEGDADWWVATGRSFYTPIPATAADELDHARRHFYQVGRHRDSFGAETRFTYDAYDLLPIEALDPLGNRATAGERHLDPTQPLVRPGLDYRVLKPFLVMDPNRNREHVLFDALGLVAATAVQGKPEDAPAPGDRLDGVTADLTPAAVAAAMADPVASATGLLGPATTRYVYDVLAFHRTGSQPAGALELAREAHGGAATAFQAKVTYSDGFTREIQVKTRSDGQWLRAETAARQQWVATGWKVYDNKGNEVRVYEPFLTATPGFELDFQAGVSAIRCYDPRDRHVATLHPNHSWDKVVIDTWGRTVWDPNDTVLVADPTADADVGDFFRRLPAAAYSPTWHARRSHGDLGPEEQTAAARAAAHAGTPSSLAVDSMGHTILTLAHNRFPGLDATDGDPPIDERHATRMDLDVEGHLLTVTDAHDRLVARYTYDLLGNAARRASMEGGDRATLDDVAGNPAYAWDGIGRRLHNVYDALRRPVELRLLHAGAGVDDDEVVLEQAIFGETLADPAAGNHRTRLAERRDQGGVAVMAAYDFKGNLTASTRRLAVDFDRDLDWANPVALDAITYEHHTSYDALNRPTALTTPDDSVVSPRYNEAGLVDRIDVSLRGAAAIPFVTAVDYDAHGRRTRVTLQNGAETTYDHDPETFRLRRLRTVRGVTPLQDLRYTFDPVGNVTHVRDDAQQDVFFANRRVEPNADYAYDAVYQLISATGREHLAGFVPSSHDDAVRLGLVHPHDGNALGTYREQYRYDRVGNLLELRHRGTDPANPGWTRSYIYGEPSQLEPGADSNRLTRTEVGGITETYSTGGDGYDADGNMLRLPHLQGLAWDHRDRLRMTQRQAGGGGQAQRTWYVYGGDGTRIRKVTEQGGQIVHERRYLGGLEVFIRPGTNGVVRETLHVRDGDRPVALVDTRTDVVAPSVVRYQLGDHLDSVRIELDAAGLVSSYEEYTPFGSTALQSAAPQLTAPKRHRYTGKERDEESGLYHHETRYYASWLGRWTSPDPAELQDSVNRYVYVRNHPTGKVDPDGRSGVTSPLLAPSGSSGASAASGAAAAGRGARGAGGSSVGSVVAGIFGAIGGFFDAVASGLAKVANVLGEWLPGVIAAPIAGLVDFIGGFFRTLGGIFSWKGNTVVEGLKEMGLGLARVVGLKEVIKDPWVYGGTSVNAKMPRSMAEDIAYVNAELPDDSWKNGHKAWHAGSNAVVQQRVGPNPLAILFLWGAGVFHESPLDKESFKQEQKNQGTVNHILDSLGDLIANVLGQFLGLLLPRIPAAYAAMYIGRYLIPGPADNDPTVKGGAAGQAYKGNPGDAWWKWKGYGKKSP